MKKEFMDYFESIDIKEVVLLARIESIYEFYLEICPDEIADVFVADYTEPEGKREYGELWFFSDRYIMRASEFARGKDDFNIAPIKDRVDHCEIRRRSYDFKGVTDASRLYLKFRVDTGVYFELRAAKENCDALKDIILKYVKSNLKG